MEKDDLAIQVAALRKQIRNARMVEERLHRRVLLVHAILLAIAIIGLVTLIHQGIEEASLPAAPELALIIIERSPLRI